MTCEACGAALGDAARFCSACGVAVRSSSSAGDDPVRDALQRALPSNLRIVRLLGRGGMGAVYLARDEFLDREVAVKTLPAEFGSDDALRDRFRREARIAARLHHPHIVPLYTFGEGENILYYVMGFVRGETLAERLAREGLFDAEEVRRIVAEIADALAYAHAQSVVHRDIKPENVLLEAATGSAFLADFGIARMTAGETLTRTGALVGTPLYMSPEQASGSAVDERSDLYSLGVVGYRMLTGRLPVVGETFGEIVAQHAARKPQRISEIDPSIPADLEEAVMRCLEKDPNARFRDARELYGALTGAETDLAEGESFRSAGAYILMFLWIALLLVPYEAVMWPDVGPGWRLLIWLIQFLPFCIAAFVALRVLQARSLGVPWRPILRSLFHPPKWYWGWTPRWLRPPRDVWDRLPFAVRAVRHFLTVLVLGASVITLEFPIPFAITENKTPVRVMLFGWVALIVVSGIFGLWASFTLRRMGLRGADASAVMHNATWVLGRARTPAIVQFFGATAAGSRATRSSRDALTELAAAVAALDEEQARLVGVLSTEDAQALEKRLAALEAAGPVMIKLRDAVRTELDMTKNMHARLDEIRRERLRLQAQLDAARDAETVAR